MIIEEDGTGKPDANSYVDHAGAFFADHLAGHLYATALSGTTLDAKERAVRMATRTLDANIEWQGYRSQDAQALEWPRAGVTVENRLVDSATIPPPIKQAVVELAIFLLRRDRTDDSTDQPVNKLSLGDGALQIDLGEGSASTAVEHVIPEAVARLVRKYGRRVGSGARQRRTSRL